MKAPFALFDAALLLVRASSSQGFPMIVETRSCLRRSSQVRFEDYYLLVYMSYEECMKEKCEGEYKTYSQQFDERAKTVSEGAEHCLLQLVAKVTVHDGRCPTIGMDIYHHVDGGPSGNLQLLITEVFGVLTPPVHELARAFDLLAAFVVAHCGNELLDEGCLSLFSGRDGVITLRSLPVDPFELQTTILADKLKVLAHALRQRIALLLRSDDKVGFAHLLVDVSLLADGFSLCSERRRWYGGGALLIRLPNASILCYTETIGLFATATTTVFDRALGWYVCIDIECIADVLRYMGLTHDESLSWLLGWCNWERRWMQIARGHNRAVHDGVGVVSSALLGVLVEETLGVEVVLCGNVCGWLGGFKRIVLRLVARGVIVVIVRVCDVAVHVVLLRRIGHATLLGGGRGGWERKLLTEGCTVVRARVM